MSRGYGPSKSTAPRDSFHKKQFHPYEKNGTSKEGCFNCGEKGHFSRECPTKKSFGGNSSRGEGCFNCGEKGHFSRECPSKKSFGGSSKEGCFNCGEQGHFSRECPSKQERRQQTDDEFYQSFNGLKYDSTDQQPFEKIFYKESEETASQTDKEIAEWKKKHLIEAYSGYHDRIPSLNNKNSSFSKFNHKFDKSSNKDDSSNSNIEYPPLPKPVLKFEHVGLPNYIMSAIKESGFEAPTPIQSVTWPMIMSGNNVIGIAQTGSGKTLAFLLPALIHIKAQKQSRDPIALIIAPTRELAQQIEHECEVFSNMSNIKYCSVYGGSPKYKQLQKIRRGAQIIIATPGRLLDFIKSGVVSCKRLTYVVMDEADRLLDMGFEPQLKMILDQIRPDRQINMFSATWPSQVRQLAKKYMIDNEIGDKNIMQVTVGGGFDKLKANINVTQNIMIMQQNEKITKLKEVIDKQLEKEKESKILIFISTKKMTNMMQDMLWEDGYYVTCIHGDKEQNQRERALNAFREGSMRIMLATDVASRGIHVDDINLVVNFDFPTQIEDYVHRIGRTGRGGKKGESITFFIEEQDGIRAKDLIKIMKVAKQEVSKELMDLQWSTGGSSKRNRGRYRGGNGGGRRGGGRGGGRNKGFNRTKRW